jgi:glycosyltransferase involved in cell wall biosynthesis
MDFSVVVPCYNQGRFLTDCLESLACQTLLPSEVVVVDDGSTDRDTIELCARLNSYYYPFALHCLRKPNGGLASARNHGIRHSAGDVILPLDSDDKLAPDALREYRDFLASEPGVDVCYPDVISFGNDELPWPGASFNRWRLTQQNLLACSSAVRRRVFDAGHWYDESKRHGCEDWEFWIRTCALGPFRAAPLRKPVFLYRRWGYSMYAAVDPTVAQAYIRDRHAAAGIWSPAAEEDLRTREAPSHRVVRPEGAPPLPCRDLLALPADAVEQFLRADRVSRFVWFGDFPPEAGCHLQLIVNEVARSSPAGRYRFVDARTSRAYLTVLDRLAAGPGCDGPRPIHLAWSERTITTDGDRQPRTLAVSDGGDFPLGAGAPPPPDLPVAKGMEDRDRDEWWYYMTREPLVPRPINRQPGGRVLAIAMPWLEYGGAEFAVRILLEEGQLRSHFDKIFVLTFEAAGHGAHLLFEPLTDAIYHLGHLPAGDDRKVAIALEMMCAAGVSDFLIVNSRHGYAMIPDIRRAELDVRITAQLHSLGHGEQEAFAPNAYPRVLASRHAALVDRVACISDQITSFMVERLYFPPANVRTVRLGVDQRRFHGLGAAGTARPRLILWCGRLSAEKDPLLALRVAEHFQARAPDVEFLFVGEGPLGREFSTRLAAAVARGRRLEWLRRSDRVDQLLRGAGCLFLTSEYEGIPIVAMEALSTGVPVVMSFANTAIGEIARPGQCFDVADRLDVDAFCQRLGEALGAPCFAPEPELSHGRYAQETVDWLFPGDRAGPRADLRSVFGRCTAA